ncbi:hypothetical protein EVJ58_g2837 [Rhodofomes roseus]|uniref:Uncharacterized protein n=1 Tax=Rhodofomes roseus TaxID=34475 RepID=A0A4Y9YSN4_9APHY|nr:hypothetical protein EVJ58_g2837 [Rhodofomes roseus]
MDKTKSKLVAFFDNDDDESSFPQKEVDDQKRTVFTQGVVRKSKREKEKEAAEAKRRDEEENAARAYAEFLDAFQGEAAERKKGGAAFVKAGESSSYAPAVRGKGAGSQGMRAFELDAMKSPSPPPVAPKPKGKRAMDSFLEEIKREQADRESRLSRHVTHGRSVTSIAAYEGQSGSKDRGDPQSTNIFVANLPSHVTEQSLGTFFARCGPVGSVKIMWPRGDATQGPGADMTASRRTKNTGLSGFVSYMKRKDAEAALRELDGFDWGGSILRVGWSKAVPIAVKPLYGVAAILTWDIGQGYNSVYSTDSAEESEREHGRKNELGKRARKRFEAMLRALSGKRGEIARCMAFSLEHAEAAAEVSDIIIASLVIDGTPVPRKVARLHLICDILHNSAAPLPMAWKFRQEFQSRLGLVFDHLSTIYHSFPGRITAETFKKQIAAIIDIWEDWIVFPPDFTAELRARLEGSTIEDAQPQEEVKTIEVKQRTPAASKFKASSFKPAEEVTKEAEPAADSDEGEQMDLGSDDEDSIPVKDVSVPLAEDIDGEPMDDVDGVPIDDIDGVPMDDIDGEPIGGEPIDGEPMEEDIDGVAVDV